MDHLSTFFKRYKIHFICWSIFILYEAVLVGFINSYFGKFGNYAIHYSIHIAAFYINAHYVLPQAFKYPKQASLRLPVYLLLMLVAYILFVFAVDYLLVMYSDITETTEKELLVLWPRLLWRCTYFLAYSTGYYYLITYLKEKKRVNALESDKLLSIIQQERIEAELVKTQNAFLKAQINPHFLFNTLTFMHSQTQKTAPRVAETILALSEMMRYALKHENLNDTADLAEEIEQLENLISLHRLSRNHEIYISLDLKGDLSEIKIIPLVLMTLLENMFKHGNLSIATAPATFQIEVNDDELKISTKNRVSSGKNKTGFNLGIGNIERRLIQKYKQDFSFSHHIDDDHYYRSEILITSIQFDPQTAPVN